MKRGEEGFTLVEALVSTGLLAFCVTGFMSTVLMAMNVVSKAKVNDAMDVIAHNALTDLYATTAYDNATASALSGQTRTYTVTQHSGTKAAGATTYTVRVHVYSQSSGEIDAAAQVNDTSGHTTSMHGILMRAAPAPGSQYVPISAPVLPHAAARSAL